MVLFKKYLFKKYMYDKYSNYDKEKVYSNESEFIKFINKIEEEFYSHDFVRDDRYVICGRHKFLIFKMKKLYFMRSQCNEYNLDISSLKCYLDFLLEIIFKNNYAYVLDELIDANAIYLNKSRSGCKKIHDSYTKTGIISLNERDYILHGLNMIKDYLNKRNENMEWNRENLCEERNSLFEGISKIELINGSCINQEVDVIVNAANKDLLPGVGVSGAIFAKAGYNELNEACRKIAVPLKDGDAVITPAFNIKNAKYIIHAVGPDFGRTPNAFKELYLAYYNSLNILKNNGLHSIAFPLISAGVFGTSLENPVIESAKQCLKSYNDFVGQNNEYSINVKLCAYTKLEMDEVQKLFNSTVSDGGVSNDLVRKYDCDLFNYYFVQYDDDIEVVTVDNRRIKEKKDEQFKYIQKERLYLRLTGNIDVTSFAAFMGMDWCFDNIRENSFNKDFIFVSVSKFYDHGYGYFSKFDDILNDRIMKDLEEFYSSKELQLKFNFVILHPICFEILDNGELFYRPLISLDDNVINQILNTNYFDLNSSKLDSYL